MKDCYFFYFRIMCTDKSSTLRQEEIIKWMLSHVAWSRFTSAINMNEVWTDLLYGFGVFGGTLSQRDLSKEFPSWYTLGLPLLSGEQISAKDIIREHLSKPEDKCKCPSEFWMWFLASQHEDNPDSTSHCLCGTWLERNANTACELR